MFKPLSEVMLIIVRNCVADHVGCEAQLWNKQNVNNIRPVVYLVLLVG